MDCIICRTRDCSTACDTGRSKGGVIRRSLNAEPEYAGACRHPFQPAAIFGILRISASCLCLPVAIVSYLARILAAKSILISSIKLDMTDACLPKGASTKLSWREVVIRYMQSQLDGTIHPALNTRQTLTARYESIPGELGVVRPGGLPAELVKWYISSIARHS